ncbi:MAG TPA: hypothetical protein VLR71_17250 [Casimicrobiaceae bacterium]|nr:hypothetical protein [Casimicrobiaceae bacterium]
MPKRETELGSAWWSQSLEEMDREVARLATLCRVRILEPGVIERVLNNDDSVCGINNPAAFRKLRDALMMHYHLRDKAVGALGEIHAAALVKRVIDRLAARYGDVLGSRD